jgi:glycosyltransferase involved in cell wall biosynthesis
MMTDVLDHFEDGAPRPTISIVTAVYNRARTIEDAIASIRAQTLPVHQHLIQDGGSTDGTLHVVRRVKGPETDLVSERDSGIYDAINRGIRRATGDVVGLLHSDDFFASTDVLAAVASAFRPDVDGVYGDLDYVSANDPSRIIRRWRSGPYTPQKLRRGWMPPHPTLFLRREVFERHGLYDPVLRIAADYDAMLRWMIAGRIRLAYVPMVFTRMRVGGASNRSLVNVMRKSREDYIAIRRNGAGGFGTLALKNVSKLHQFLPGRD